MSVADMSSKTVSFADIMSSPVVLSFSVFSAFFLHVSMVFFARKWRSVFGRSTGGITGGAAEVDDSRLVPARAPASTSATVACEETTHHIMGSCQHELHLKPASKPAAADDAGADIADHNAKRHDVSRRNSRSRGINFKTVSPLLPSAACLGGGSRWPSSEHTYFDESPLNQGSGPAYQRRSVSEPHFDHPDKYSPLSAAPSPRLVSKFDFALPTSEDIESLDINDKLRLLALKEMAVVEIKDSISDLQTKLYDSERDLHTLRSVIQRSLYRQLSNQSQATEPPKPDRQSTKKSPQKSQAQHQRSKSGPGSAPYSFPPGHGRSASASKTSSGPAPFTPTMKPPGAYSRSPRPQRSPGSPRSPGRAGDRSSKIWSNFSKPITFIQNLDSMISQEFEKSLGSDKKSSSKNTSSATSETRAGESTDANPLNRLGFSNSDKNSSFRHLMDSKLNGMSGIYPKESSDDMFQAVSNSLWGFVNDMKTNMASTLVVEPPSSTEDDTTHGHNKPQPRENRHGSVSSLTGGSTRSKDTVPSFQLAVPQEAHIKETGELESSVDLLEFNDDEDEVLDLTMYSAMRTKQD